MDSTAFNPDNATVLTLRAPSNYLKSGMQDETSLHLSSTAYFVDFLASAHGYDAQPFRL